MSFTLTTTKRGASQSFVALDALELGMAVHTIMEQRYGREFQVQQSVIDRGHTAAAAKVTADGRGAERTIISARVNQPIEALRGDIVLPSIRITDQSYPGAALRVQTGLYRLICTNGLMGLVADGGAEVIPHYKNREALLQDLASRIYAALDKTDATVARVQQLATTEVRDPQAVIAVLPGLPVAVRQQADYLVRSGRHRDLDNPNTVWGLYNILNEADRQRSRRNSLAYLDRDEGMVDAIIAAA